MRNPRIAIMHYAAPPVVGGVEAVIAAHASVLVETGYPVTVLAGRGDREALAPGTGFIHIPDMDSQQEEVAAAAASLSEGRVPANFSELVVRVRQALEPHLELFDRVIVHNVFSKHSNLPLTAAICELLDAGKLGGCIAWGHDFTWTSPNSSHLVHPGYPWEAIFERDIAPLLG